MKLHVKIKDDHGDVACCMIYDVTIWQWIKAKLWPSVFHFKFEVKWGKKE